MDATTLPDDIDALKGLLAEKDKVLLHRDAKIKVLEEQLNLYKAEKYGQSSEQTQYHQMDLFENGEQPKSEDDTDESEEEVATVEEYTRIKKTKKAGRKPLPEHLERVEVIHDLPPEQRFCSIDGEPLKEIGRVISEQLEIIPSVVRVKRHIRIKYACNACDQTIKLAPLPPQPIPKSMASASLLSHIAISKYVDALPLYRQSNILKRADINISRATMATWMVLLGKQLQPLINLLREHLLTDTVIHCDETTFQVLKEPGRDAATKSYMWVQKTGSSEQPVVLFDYFASRSSQVPLKLFNGFSGYLQVDGYQGYNAVSDKYDVTLVGCWNHARRKFMNVIKAMEKKSKQKVKAGKATKGINYIKRLYGIEKDIKDKTIEEKYEIRQARAKPILDDMKKWIDQSMLNIAPKTLIGKAISYVNNEWIKLYCYIDDGRLNIDNNPAENAIRPYVVGRKNWLFSDSMNGAYAGAAIYSIVETAKANNLNPFNYMRHVVECLPVAESVEDIEALLPWNVALG